MNKSNSQKGEISIGIGAAIALVGVIVAPVAAFYSAQLGAQKDLAGVSERVKAVETFVPTIDKRLENIEKALKIVPANNTTANIKP